MQCVLKWHYIQCNSVYERVPFAKVCNSIAKEANNFTNLERVLIVFETDPSLSKSISLSALSFNYLNNSLCLFGADYDNYLLEHFPTNYQRN